MFTARPSHYVPLSDEGHDKPSDGCGPSSPFLDERRRKSRSIPWTLILVIVCTLLNVTLSVFPALLSQKNGASQPNTVITRQNIHLLRRPNQYIGFDEIPRPSPPVSRQLTSYPILLSLVDASSPDTVFDDDFAKQMVHSGTITPDFRRVRATPTMSTIVQFRAIDWGMDICELHVDIPERVGEEAQSGTLAIYRLNSTIPLDTLALSYNTCPPRVAKLGTISLGDGTATWHRKFNCETDEVLSFEIGCLPSEESGDSDCLMDWVQVKDETPAIHMVQHATV